MSCSTGAPLPAPEAARAAVRIADDEDGTDTGGARAPAPAPQNAEQPLGGPLQERCPLSAEPSSSEASGLRLTPESSLSCSALYVIADAAGFVGAFPSAAAAEAAMRPHPLVPYITLRFAAAPGPVSAVWVVLYRDLDAVAFVSNDRGEAARVQQVYASVGLAYDDDIDYWEQPFGVVAPRAAERLAIQTRAHRTWGAMTEADFRAAEEADAARAEGLCAPRADGPLARAFRENERLAILDAVVPLAAPASSFGEGGGPPGPAASPTAVSDGATDESEGPNSGLFPGERRRGGAPPAGFDFSIFGLFPGEHQPAGWAAAAAGGPLENQETWEAPSGLRNCAQSPETAPETSESQDPPEIAEALQVSPDERGGQ